MDMKHVGASGPSLSAFKSPVPLKKLNVSKTHCLEPIKGKGVLFHEYPIARLIEFT